MGGPGGARSGTLAAPSLPPVSGNARETAGIRMHDRGPEGEAERLWARANGYLVPSGICLLHHPA